MTHGLPYVIAFVLVLAFLILLFTFRSIVIPIKAIVLNLLSVAASYGVLVLVFQHHWAEGLLGFHSTGWIISWLPVFLFVVLFGLSMDYHVFILSRVREGIDNGMSNEGALRYGIARTAGVVTSAALVMFGVFSLFATASSLDLKQAGVGLAVAVILDATVVRAVLLPASMKLLGDWNWYLPRWLAWLPSRSPRRRPDKEPARAERGSSTRSGDERRGTIAAGHVPASSTRPRSGCPAGQPGAGLTPFALTRDLRVGPSTLCDRGDVRTKQAYLAIAALLAGGGRGVACREPHLRALSDRVGAAGLARRLVVYRQWAGRRPGSPRQPVGEGDGAHRVRMVCELSDRRPPELAVHHRHRRAERVSGRLRVSGPGVPVGAAADRARAFADLVGSRAGHCGLGGVVAVLRFARCPLPSLPRQRARGRAGRRAGERADSGSSGSAGVVIVLLALALIVVRWSRASALQRRTVAPVVWGGGVTLAALVVSVVNDALGHPLGEAPKQILFVALATLPIGMVLALLQRRLARAAVAGLVVELGEPQVAAICDGRSRERSVTPHWRSSTGFRRARGTSTATADRLSSRRPSPDA